MRNLIYDKKRCSVCKAGIVLILVGGFISFANYKFQSESENVSNRWYIKQVKKARHDQGNMHTLDRSALRTSNNAKLKVILLWKPVFDDRHLSPQPKDCPGCVLTYDQTSMPFADAIVFHCNETRDTLAGLPLNQRKATDQRWVWFCMESPCTARHAAQKSLAPFNEIFNWTMTLRWDSDVTAVHYPSSMMPVEEMFEMKNATSLAAWIESDRDTSAMKAFVSELKKYLSVDVMKKSSERELPGQHSDISRYKFYLALEDPQCKNYIGEKFWSDALDSRTVPIVRGPPREQYELVAPPDSFIHVDDFANVQELAKHLKKLDKNDALYARHLRWWENDDWRQAKMAKYEKLGLLDLRETVRHNRTNVLCNLCEKLRFESPRKRQTIHRLDSWWFAGEYFPKVG